MKPSDTHRLFLDNAPDFVFVSRIEDFMFTDVNRRACEFYGYSRDEFLAMTIFDIEVAPPLERQVRELYDQTPTGKVVEVYGTNRKKDGSTFSVQVRFVKLDDEFALAHVRDITAEQRLEDRDIHFRHMLEQLNDAVFLIDAATGNVIYANQQARTNLQYDREELLAMNIIDFQEAVPNMAAWDQVIESLHRQIGTTFIQGIHKRKDGTLLPVEVNIRYVAQNPGGDYVVAVARDVSERRAFEEQLRQAQKMRAIGELTAGISHNFNNLLTAIIGNIQVAAMTLENDPERAAKHLEKALEPAKESATLIDDLMRLSTDKMPEFTPISVATVITGAVDVCRQGIDRNVCIRYEPDHNLPKISASESQMRQVLMNVLLNAHDAGARQIDITAQQDGDGIIIEVTDDGEGIGEEIKTEIFNPFFSTKPVGHGTGLGLSTSYAIVKSHSGDITFTSTPGEGSVFTIRLPID